MKLADIFGRFKGLVTRPPIDLVEGRYWESTVTPDDKARRVYTYNASQADLLMRATGYVHICAAMNSVYCASVPVRLYTKSKKAKGKRLAGKRLAWLRNGVVGKAATYADNADGITEVLDSPALALLSNPNFSDTGIESRRLLFYFLENPGNAYWQHDATESAPPKNLLTLYPQWVNQIVGDNGIEGYRYGRNQTQQVDLPSTSVIQFRHLPSPQNPWMGVGCLNSSTVEADIYASAIIYEQSFWNNGARPDFAIKMPPGSTAEQVKQVEAMMQRKHQGARKGGKPLIATDVEVTPLQWSPKDMEYGDGIDRMRRTICNAFGVPLAMLEMNDSALGDGGGRMFQSRTQYLQQTIKPRMDSFCERLTENYLPLFGLEPGEFWFAADNPDPEDTKTMEAGAVALYGGGIIKLNEARARVGEDPVPDGDAFRAEPTNPFAAFAPKAEPPKLPEPKQAAKCLRPAKPEVIYHRLAVVAGKGGSLFSQSKGKAALSETLPYSPEIEAACRRFFDQLTVDVAGSKLLFDPKAAAELFVTELTGPLLRSFGAGYNKGSAEVPGDLGAFAIDNDAARAFAKDYVTPLSRTITDTVRDVLREELTNQINEGASPYEVARALRERVSGLSKTSSEMIARTESARTYVGGNIAAWDESGVVVGKKWQVSSDACDFCQEVAASFNEKSIPLNQPFFEKGSVLSAGGRTMVLDYSNVDGPPLHPSCECSIEPVLEGEE